MEQQQQVTPELLNAWFTERQLGGAQQQKYGRVLGVARQFATAIIEQTPQGPEQLLALRQVREACDTAYRALQTGAQAASGG